MVGAYVEARDYKRFAVVAKRRGMTVADLVRQLVKECIERAGGR